MRGLKIAVIGAGSTYTPELVNGFIERKDELPVSSFYLMDIDMDKLGVVGNLAQRMLEANGVSCELVMTGDLKTALKNADFIVSQIRVGRLDARIKDEKIPLKYGLIGQETTGLGGFMKGMRTIPVMIDIADNIKRYCPEAWLINFSNPSGIIAEVVLNYTDVKMMGLCNGPINMKKQVMGWIPEDTGEVVIDYLGLNHLSWITGVFCDGRDILQEKLYDVDISSKLKNIPKLDWDPYILNKVKALPCGYLKYYYSRNKMLEHLKSEERSRGEVCKEIEAELLQMYQNPELKEKPAALDKRGGALYSEAAVSLISAIYNDKNEIHVVNTKNCGALDFMNYDDVVEISCNINKNGATPIPLKGFDNADIKNFMKLVKNYEKRATSAGFYGDYNEGLMALLIHPLAGGDYYNTKAALDELMEAHKEYLPQFFKKKA